MPVNYNTVKFYNLSLEVSFYWDGPNFGATGLDASGIFGGVKQQICAHQCEAKKSGKPLPKINLVGWSRGATVVMEIAEELQDDGCCCSRNFLGFCCDRIYPAVNWMGLFDAVDMTATWGWANNITSNVRNASHVIKSEKQMFFPTSSAKAEDATRTNVNTVKLKDSTHNDVGATSEAALHWMVDEARNAGVKMQKVAKNYIVEAVGVK